MTLEVLFSVQTDNNKLRSLYIELANHEDFNPYKKNIVSDMPSSGVRKDFAEWYATEKERIESEIEFYKNKIQEDRKNVEAFIREAPHPECDIIRYRVINNLSWEEIGSLTGYSRRSVSNKFYNYIKNTENTKNTAQGVI